MLSVTPTPAPDGRLQLHASTVVIGGRAVAFAGPSGSGKSTFALALLARGAILLADDITWIETTPNGLIAHCPPILQGRIEARGVGILRADFADAAPLELIVDLGVPELARLPERRTTPLLGHRIPLLHTPDTAHFVDAILTYMLHGLAD